MSLPLADIRVVEFSQAYAGPATTMLLADHGAEVIKVEPPEGDPVRELFPIPSNRTLSQHYLALNRNKRGIVLDLTTRKGREVAHHLVRWADAAVCNLRGSVSQRLGITYEDLTPINPRLIYASITGYGERGPDTDLEGYDIVIQARSGTMVNGHLPDGTLVTTPSPYSDMASAFLAVYGIMLALRERERTGRGQKIEVNLLHTALTLETSQMIKVSGVATESSDRARRPTLTCYRCSDGGYLLVSVVPQQWRRLCRALGQDSLADNPAFGTGEKRQENFSALYAILSRIFATKPAAEWGAIFAAGNVPGNVVRETVEGVFEDPQVAANQMFAQFQQPGIGPVTVVNTPLRLSGSADEPRFRRPAPEKGEHTLEVLRELGYSSKEIGALKADGVIG